MGVNEGKCIGLIGCDYWLNVIAGVNGGKYIGLIGCDYQIAVIAGVNISGR